MVAKWLNKNGKYVGLSFLVLVVLFIMRSKLARLTGVLTAPSDAAIIDNAIQTTGADNATAKACMLVADDVYKALHSSWDEDEDSVVSALNRVNTLFQARLVSSIYRQKYDTSLKADVEKYLQFDLLRIKSIVKNNYY